MWTPFCGEVLLRIKSEAIILGEEVLAVSTHTDHRQIERYTCLASLIFFPYWVTTSLILQHSFPIVNKKFFIP
jgi:hypothetical protein